MLAKSLRNQLAADPNFRLAIAQAAKSVYAVNAWIVRRILRDDAFADLFLPILKRVLGEKISKSGRERWDQMNIQDREQVIVELCSLPVFGYLVLEAIGDNDNRLKVIAGLEGSLKKLTHGASEEESLDKPSDSYKGATFLRWALAGIVSTGTVAGGLVATHAITSTVKQLTSETRSLEQKQTDDLSRTVTSRGSASACDLSSSCQEDSKKGVNDLIAQWAIKQNEDSKMMATALQQIGLLLKSASDPPERNVTGPSILAVPEPLTVDLKLDNLPPYPKNELPPSLSRIEMEWSHELQPLPASTICTFAVSTRKIANPLLLTFRRLHCSDGDIMPLSVSETTGEIRVSLNGKSLYVPSLDAYVAVEAERGGFLHLGRWHTATVSVRSAVYSDRQVRQAELSATKNVGKQEKIGPLSQTLTVHE